MELFLLQGRLCWCFNAVQFIWFMCSSLQPVIPCYRTGLHKTHVSETWAPLFTSCLHVSLPIPLLCCNDTGVMFTCDAFGAHYCTVDAFDTELEALAPHYRFYYDCLMCVPGYPEGCAVWYMWKG